MHGAHEPGTYSITKRFEQRVAGVNLWLFWVDDGGADLVGSGESPGSNSIYVIRADPTDQSALASIQDADWHPLITLTELGGVWGQDLTYTYGDGTSEHQYQSIADHWHIYAHGFHWIALSLTPAPSHGGVGVGVALVKFEMLSAGPVVHDARVIWSPKRAADWWPDNLGGPTYRVVHPTNDLFLTTTRTGVAIGINRVPRDPGANPEGWKDGKGSKILMVEGGGAAGMGAIGLGAGQLGMTGRVGDTLDFRSVLVVERDFSHSNAASAQGVMSGGLNGINGRVQVAGLRYRLLAPDAISVTSRSEISLILSDEDWNPSSRTILLEDALQHYSMADEAFIPGPGLATSLLQPPDSGLALNRAMVYKRVGLDEGREAGDERDDAGELRIRLYQGSSEIDKAVTQAGTYGNRCHLSYWEGHLIVGWDRPTIGSTDAGAITTVYALKLL